LYEPQQSQLRVRDADHEPPVLTGVKTGERDGPFAVHEARDIGGGGQGQSLDAPARRHGAW
jgi:hypothetical protein